MSETCPYCDRANCERLAIEQRGKGEAFWDVEAYLRSLPDCDANKPDWRARALAAEDRLSRLAKLLLGCADELAGALADLGDDDEPEMDDFIAECRVAASDALPDPRRDPGGKEKT